MCFFLAKNVLVARNFSGVYILQNTLARGGGMVQGKKMKNEVVRKKKKGKSPLKWCKNSSSQVKNFKIFGEGGK